LLSDPEKPNNIISLTILGVMLPKNTFLYHNYGKKIDGVKIMW
jgi:hypothetical protein